jgi:thiamine pyrophosphate-dependent acetolactate synthase large subunit-like protein
VTLTTLPAPTPATARDRIRALGRLVAPLRLVLATVGAVSAGAGRTLIRLARWFAAEPRRIHTAVTGVCLAAVCGAAIGLAVGAVTNQVVGLVLDTVSARH